MCCYSRILGKLAAHPIDELVEANLALCNLIAQGQRCCRRPCGGPVVADTDHREIRRGYLLNEPPEAGYR